MQDRRCTTGSLIRVPTRSCLACRRRGDKPSLLRLTVAGGTVTVDPSATLPGRGAYLCHRESCVDAALARNASKLRRALRQASATIDDTTVRQAIQQTSRDKHDAQE